MKNLKLAVTALASTALIAAAPSPAAAETKGQGAPTVTVLTSSVAAPYNLAVRGDRLLVADGGTSLLSRLRRDGTLRTVATGPTPPGEVAGVAISKTGRYTAYTTTEHPDPQNPFINANGTLVVLDRYGPTRTVDLEAYEETANPDGAVSYGLVDPSDCAREAIEAIPEVFPPPSSYTGLVDSHPYSVAAYGKRSWVVADAGGNDLLKINQRGQVSTIAVLPVQPVTFTAEIAESFGLADCVVGETFNFEAVPTDVEVGKNGWLYVTTLAGGPESAALGARSSVYKVNPRTGKVKLVATGLAGATNLALHHGKIYVAELFAGRISVIKNGKAVPYVSLPGAVSVESSGTRHKKGHLYAGTLGNQDPPAPGTVVKITPSGPKS